jgi:4-amino-4-deoxy-L-arabinose transferase-like glycosyltransferase
MFAKSQDSKALISVPISILLLWIFVTAFNINKAVHIDDTAYLYCARAAAIDWLKPYAGLIHWGSGKFVQLSHISQPALSFYPLALSIRLFGESEIALHLVQSIYSLIAIISFYKIAKILGCMFPLTVTALFCISPSFIPSQNLMTDVPALSFMMLSFLFLCKGLMQPDFVMPYLKSGLTTGFACLIKYSASIMLVVYFVGVCLKGSLKTLLLLLIPAALILVWAIFSYIDSGTVHILKPQLKEFGSRFSSNSRDWFICLGAITPFSLLFIRTFFRDWLGRFSILTVLVLCLLWSPEALASKTVHYNLNYAGRLFFANGLIVSAGALLEALYNLRIINHTDYRKKIFLLLLVWCISAYFFFVLVSRFIAVRHILLVLPAILFILAFTIINRISSAERYLSLLLTASLGILLALSDWQYADIYRKAALNFSEKYKNQLWSNGTWGWQWYTTKAGMKIYVNDSDLKVGDIVIKPVLTSSIAFSSKHQSALKKIEEIYIPSGPMTWFRTMSAEPWGGFYSSVGNALPWRITRAPLEKFEVYQYFPEPDPMLGQKN